MSPKSPKFGPTQRDIAKALDISQACVAIALNPKSRNKLPEETVAMIEAKARELKYRPQRQASILRSGRSHTIGVVCQAGVYHAPQERVRHLAHSAIRAGYQLISLDMGWFEGDIAAAQNYLLGVAAEGVIFCNIPAEKQVSWREFIQERSLPVVSLGDPVDALDQAQFDLRSAYREMTLHHLEQGGRRLHLLLSYHDAVPADKLRSVTLADRVEGFVEAIQTTGGEVIAEPETGRIFGLPSEPASRRAGIVGQVHYPLRTELYKDVFDLGYFEMKRLLQEGMERPDSLICSNDDIAIGAMAACAELGICIPDTLRVSGADNAPFSRRAYVPLSTIEQPSQSMAEWGIRRIVELIENPAERQHPKTEVFPCELIFRKSTLCFQ